MSPVQNLGFRLIEQRRRRMAVANSAPNQPTLSAGTLTSSGATLTGSAFSDPDVGDTHAASQWQVTTAADTGFASPVYNPGDDATNKTSLVWSGGSASTGYLARVRYKDSAGNYSDWSAAAPFTTTSGGTVNRADNFNRADAPTLGTPSDGGSAWTPRFGSYAVVGNQASATTQSSGTPWSATFAVAVSTLACSKNGTVAITIPVQAGNQGVVFRYSDANNLWAAFLSGAYLYVDKVQAGVKTPVISTLLSKNYPAIGDGAIVSVVLTDTGFTLQTTMGGVTQDEQTVADTFNNTAVEHGIISSYNATTLENFSFTGAP